MIKSFKDKETAKLFQVEKSKKIPPHIRQKTLNKLLLLNAIASINDLRTPPSNHLEQLTGNRKGQYSIRINKKWRICFNWIENNAYNVEITDYHQ